MAPSGLSPLTSCASGLALLPSAESLDHRSVYSLAQTGSTCTIASVAQSTTERDGPRGRSQTKTMRTKDIEKSPVPHRFHLVPSDRRHPSQKFSRSPKPTKPWKYSNREREADAESLYSMKTTPSVYDTEFPEPPEDDDYDNDDTGRNVKRQRLVIEELLADAVESPVYDTFPMDADAITQSPYTESFTFVQDQSSKRKHFSPSYQSIEERPEILDKPSERSSPLRVVVGTHLPSTVPNVQTDDYMRANDGRLRLPSPFPLDADQSDDAFRGLDELEGEEEALLKAAERTDLNANLGRPTSLSTSIDHSLADTSVSAYSQPSQSSSNEPSNRRATDGNLALQPQYTPPNSESSDRRKFALRRQAIYAGSSFQIALPQSESESSSHGLAGTGFSERNKIVYSGPTSAGCSTSAYIISPSPVPRSTWSTSTSGASLRSFGAGDTDTNDDRLTDLPPLSSNLSLASDKLGRFSIQDDLLALNRNILMDDDAMLMTSTPPPKTRIQIRSQRSLALATSTSAIVSPDTSIVAVNGSAEGRQLFRSVRDRGSDWRQWAPLRLARPDTIHPAIICIPNSASERLERVAAWREDPEHHPIVQDLLHQVDKTLVEWKRAATFLAYF